MLISITKYIWFIRFHYVFLANNLNIMQENKEVETKVWLSINEDKALKELAAKSGRTKTAYCTYVIKKVIQANQK